MARRARPGKLVSLPALALILATVFLWADPASAHVDFLGSEPADGATLAEPVGELRFEFSGAVEAVPEQVFLFDGDGAALEVSDVAVEGDDTTLVVTPAEPLAGGRFGAQWAVRAGDSHPRTGAVTFEVSAPATPDQAPPPPSAAPPAESGEGSAASGTAPGDVAPADSGDAPAGTDDRSGADDELAVALAGAAERTEDGGLEVLHALGRFLSYAGIVLAVGVAAFIAWVFEGRRNQVRPLCRMVVVGASLAIAGGAVEAAALVASLDDGAIASAFDPAAWSNLTDSEGWIGLLLRVAGGALMALTAYSVRPRQTPAETDHRRRVRQPEPALSERGTVATPGAGGSGTTAVASRDKRLRFSVGGASVLGALLLLASGSFIGHTASASPRLLVAASDFAHLAAASIWAGGVFALASTLRRRKLSGSEGGSALLTARFSVSATWSLVLVAATGAVMAWAILPAPSALWSSTFGRILLLKVLLVAAIASLGAYNHFVLVPDIREGGAGPATSGRLRATLAAELTGFVAVIVATAALVGASPT